MGKYMGNLCFTLDTHEFLIRNLKSCEDEIMIFSYISPLLIMRRSFLQAIMCNISLVNRQDQHAARCIRTNDVQPSPSHSCTKRRAPQDTG